MKDTDRNGIGAKAPGRHDETFKRHAVELTLLRDRKVKDVAEELGVTPWVLYQWRRLYGPQPGGTVMATAPRTLAEAEVEIRRLRADNVRLREREIVLKKSLGILSETPERGMPRLRR
jgi:transposase